MRVGNLIVEHDDSICVTGAAGFIGTRVVDSLLEHGFRHLRCIARPSSDCTKLEASIRRCPDGGRIELFRGNLLSREDCARASKDVKVIYHLAAGRGEKSFPDAYINSVVTTRNLLEAAYSNQCLARFVNISSFSVYSNIKKPQRRLLDEMCPVEIRGELRGDAYSFAKVKQDEIVAEYAEKYGISCVTVRPGVVYGPGNEGIHGRVGIGTFGVFLHLGGSNKVPFTYVDNCAEAIVLAGLTGGVDGEVFNVVDDDLPSSRQFLRSYKTKVRHFHSIYVPHLVSYILCYLWERYSDWSEGQLPPAFNRRMWHVYWKGTRYSNRKLKSRLGWSPKVSTADALNRHFESCREKVRHA